MTAGPPAGAKAGVGDLDGALNDKLELLRNSAACDEQAPPGKACRSLGYLLAQTGRLYAATELPNLNEPAKAARLLEQAIHIQERFAALDPHDGQARFDLAGRVGMLGDALGSTDPKRALALYERALGMSGELASKDQSSGSRIRSWPRSAAR